MYATLLHLQAENRALREKVRRLGGDPYDVQFLTPRDRLALEMTHLFTGRRDRTACEAALKEQLRLKWLGDLTEYQLPHALAYAHAWARVVKAS